MASGHTGILSLPAAVGTCKWIWVRAQAAGSGALERGQQWVGGEGSRAERPPRPGDCPCGRLSWPSPGLRGMQSKSRSPGPHPCHPHAPLFLSICFHFYSTFKETETEGETSSICWLTSQNPITCAITCCLPGCAPSGSQTGIQVAGTGTRRSDMGTQPLHHTPPPPRS